MKTFWIICILLCMSSLNSFAESDPMLGVYQVKKFFQSVEAGEILYVGEDSEVCPTQLGLNRPDKTQVSLEEGVECFEIKGPFRVEVKGKEEYSYLESTSVETTKSIFILEPNIRTHYESINYNSESLLLIYASTSKDKKSGAEDVRSVINKIKSNRSNTGPLQMSSSN